MHETGSPKDEVRLLELQLEQCQQQIAFLKISKALESKKIYTANPVSLALLGIAIIILSVMASILHLQVSRLQASPPIKTIVLYRHAEYSKNSTDTEVFIRRGKFFLGSNSGRADEQPMREIYLDDYAISRYEISNCQYQKFVKAVGHRVPYLANKDDSRHLNWDPLYYSYPQGMDNYPVVLVSWHDAMAYCLWLSGIRKQNITLPTEAQWEKAARRANQHYPWGNDRNLWKQRGNFFGNEDGFPCLAPVSTFARSASPHGCYNMLGNVSEWCRDSYKKDAYRRKTTQNPYLHSDIRIWPWKVLRGSHWETKEAIPITARFFARAQAMSIHWGFRYVIN